MDRRCWIVLGACSSPTTPLDAPLPIVITAEVGSTRFVVREHMLAAAEMQISGEPFAEAMGRDLANYSRAHIPPDIYFDTSPDSGGPFIDLPGFSTGVESYEYSKQPMNNLAFESGAGTSLLFGPLTNPTAMATAIQHFASGSHALGRFVFPDSPLGWPGIWPTNHVFATFDPAIAPTSSVALACAITSDDDPGTTGALGCADYECDASTLHLPDRASQIEAVITPGADGFSGWKYGLWVLNYLQVMHDSTEAPVTAVAEADLANVGSAGNQIAGVNGSGMPTAPGTFLGSSDIEGFQAQMFIAAVDNRAADWLEHLSTTDGATLSGFASLADALAYNYNTPLRWFPGRIAVTETDDASGFPRPSYTLASSDSDVLDGIGLVLAYAEFLALTDTSNRDVGGAQPAIAYFDGDPFPSDNQLADGEATLHDRALAMLRVAVIDLDRLHADPGGVLVDTVAMTGTTPARGTTTSTTNVAYALLGLRTALRSLSSQLELYSNNTPDRAIGTTPLDTLPIAFPGNTSLTFTGRIEALVQAEAVLLLDHLTDDTGRAFDGWNLATNAPIDDADVLDSYTAAIRGLFAAYLATGDVRYHDRAIAVYERMDAVFYDPAARIYSVTAAPVDSVEFTPLRFALLQSALRDVYELVASRPGGEALEPVLEQRVARLNKLVLNGWDDRNNNRIVEWPSECVSFDVAANVPRGGLQMAERTLTGEIGSLDEVVTAGTEREATSDREHDCVPEIDDAHLPAALADSITFHIARP